MKPTRRIVPTLVAPLHACGPSPAPGSPCAAPTGSLTSAEALTPWQMAASEAYCGLKMGLPPHRRMYVDLKAQKDGVVNYAELKRKYTAMARAAGIQQPTAAGGEAAAAAAGADTHAASSRGTVYTNLIRSLELRYAQGDMDEDEEGSDDGDGSDEDGSEDDEGEEGDVLLEADGEAEADDESGDESDEEHTTMGVEEQGNATTTPAKNKDANGPEKLVLSGAKKRKASQPQKVRYDPDFIDDSDIARVKKGTAKAVHSGFFVNQGELQIVQEGNGAAQQSGRRRAAATASAAGPSSGATAAAAEKPRANKAKDKGVDKSKGKEDNKAAAAGAEKLVTANPAKAGAAASKKRARSAEEGGVARRTKKVKGDVAAPVAPEPAVAGQPAAQQQGGKDAAGPHKQPAPGPGTAAPGGARSLAQMAALAGKAAGKSVQGKSGTSGGPATTPAGTSGSPAAMQTQAGRTPTATQQLSPPAGQHKLPSSQPSPLRLATNPAVAPLTASAPGVPATMAAGGAAAGVQQPQQARRMRALQDHTSSLKALKNKLVQASKNVMDGGAPLKLAPLKSQLGNLALSCFREGLGQPAAWHLQVSKLIAELLEDGREMAFGNPPTVDAQQLEAECAKQVEDAQRTLSRLKEELKAHISVWAGQQPSGTADTPASLPAVVLACLDKLASASRKLCTTGSGKNAEVEQQHQLLQEVASWDASGRLSAEGLRIQLDAMPRASAKAARAGSTAPTAATEVNAQPLSQLQVPHEAIAGAGSQEAPKRRKKAQRKQVTSTPEAGAHAPAGFAAQAQQQAGSISPDATEDDLPDTGSPAMPLRLGTRPSVITLDDEATEDDTEIDALEPCIVAALACPAAAQAHLTAARIRTDAAKLRDSFARNIFMAALYLGPEGGTTRRLVEVFIEKQFRTEAGELWTAESVKKGIEKINRKLNKLSDIVVFIGNRCYAYVGFGVTSKEKPVRAPANVGSGGAVTLQVPTQAAE